VLETLRETLRLPLPDTAIAAALRNVRWQGRFQLISEDPPTLLDGAHNPDGAKALVNALKAIRPELANVAFVCGHCADKDVEGFYKTLSTLAPATSLSSAIHIWTVPIPTTRSMTPEQTATIAHRFGLPVTPCSDIATAITAAQTWAREHNACVVICGSLYLVGDILRKT